MDKNKRNLLIIGAVVLVVAALLSMQFNSPESHVPTTQPDSVPVPTAETKPIGTEIASTQEVLNEEMLMAILWMQNASEYRALCYQAYNIALERVKWAIANRMFANVTNALPLAIVLDLDETVLDNIPTDAMRIGTDIPYSDLDWDAWVAADEVEAMPGAVKFLNAVDKLGVQIFYVSNRKDKLQEGTAKSMARLGFPQLTDEHFLFKTDSSDKMARFEQIRASYDVIVFLGDSLGDLPLNSSSADSAGRSVLADENANKFGVSYIVLPNPVYGRWENSLAKDYFTSTENQYKVRRELLKIWRPGEAAQETSAELKAAAD